MLGRPRAEPAVRKSNGRKGESPLGQPATDRMRRGMNIEPSDSRIKRAYMHGCPSLVGMRIERGEQRIDPVPNPERRSDSQVPGQGQPKRRSGLA